MDKLQHYWQSENNASSYPYYETPFAERSDLGRITVPTNDVLGCVYYVKQLLQKGDLDHHLSILKLLQT